MADETIALGLTVNEDGSVQKAKDDVAFLQQAEKDPIQIKIDAVNSSKSIGELKRGIKELKSEALNFDANTPEYNRLVAAAGKATDKIHDLSKAVNANQDAGSKLQLLAGVGNSIAGGFAAAQGAATLFGGASKDLEKQLLKVQAATALATGVAGIANGIKEFGVLKNVAVNAFNSIKVAIGSTGIGIIVIALGLIITNFEKIKQSVEALFPALKNMGKLFEDFKKVAFGVIGGIVQAFKGLGEIIYDALSLNFDKLQVDAKDYGKNVAKAYNDGFDEEAKDIEASKSQARAQKLSEQLSREIKIRQAAGKDVLKLQKQQAEAELAALDQSDKSNKEYLDKLADVTAAGNAIKKKAIDDAKKLNDEIQGLKDESFLSGLTPDEKEVQDVIIKYKKIETDAKGNAKALAEIENLKWAEINNILDKQLTVREQKQAEADAKELEFRKKQSEEFIQRGKDEFDQTQKFTDEFYAGQEADLTIKYNNGLVTETDYQNGLLQIQLQALEQKKKNEIDYAQSTLQTEKDIALKTSEINKKKIADEKAQMAARFDAAQSSLNSLKSLTEIFGASQKKNSALQKGIAVAQIAIDTAKGISGAVAAGAGLPFPANIPAIISGVAAVLAGIAQAKTALSASGDSSGVDTGGGVTSAGISGSVATPQPLLTGIPTAATPTTSLPDNNNPQNTNPIKVYVTESDIRKVSNNVDRILTRAIISG